MQAGDIWGIINRGSAVYYASTGLYNCLPKAPKRRIGLPAGEQRGALLTGL